MAGWEFWQQYHYQIPQTSGHLVVLFPRSTKCSLTDAELSVVCPSVHPSVIVHLSNFFKLYWLPQFSSRLSDIWLECSQQYCPQTCFHIFFNYGTMKLGWRAYQRYFKVYVKYGS